MTDNDNNMDNMTVEDLKAKLSAMREEIKALREREATLEETRRAMLFLLEDINEKTADIEKAKNEWESTFDTIASPIYIHDEEYRIVRCNTAYSEVAGIGFKEIIGRPYYEIFPTGDGPMKSSVELMGFHGAAGGEDALITHCGRIYAQRVYRLERSEDGGFYSLHVMDDITDAKRAENRDRILAEFNTRVVSHIALHHRLRIICDTITRFDFKLAWIEFPLKSGRGAGQAGDLPEALSSTSGGDEVEGWPGREAIRLMRPVIRNNLNVAEWFEPYSEEAARLGHRSLGSFPMMVGDEVVGVLNIYHGSDVFPAGEVSFLSAFAGTAGVYIRNSLLFEDLQTAADHLAQEAALNSNLLKLSESIAHTRDTGILMREATSRVREILGCGACLGYLYNIEEAAFTPSEGAGITPESAPLFRVERLGRDIPVIETAVGGSRPAVMRIRGGNGPGRTSELDVSQTNFPRILPGLDAMAAIPLFARGGQLLGVMLCLYADGDNSATHLTERGEELMRGISHQVSIALEEARLYVESMRVTMDLTRKVETIQTMHEIDKSILSTLESAVVLDMTAMMVGKLISCDMATVCLVDSEKGGLVYRTGFGVEWVEKGTSVPYADTLLTEVITSGRPLFVPDLGDTSKIGSFERGMLDSGVASMLSVPLTVKSGVVGVLSLWSTRVAAYTPEDLSTLEKLSSQISIAFENSRLMAGLEELFIGVVRTLSEAIDAKSPWTRGHSERVTAIGVQIGRAMGLDEETIKTLELAGLLHDIGKLGTYEGILDKPGKLTPEENEMMRQHSGKGADILSPIRQMGEIVPIIRHHHEFFDGTGYPDGIKGTDIPPLARILTVADTVDAMSSDRPYRKGRSMEVITHELERCSGTQFDPDVVEAFLRTPVARGAVVELAAVGEREPAAG